MAGDDVWVIFKIPNKFMDISGIDSHCVNDLPIVTAGGVVPSQKGEVIVILNQYAYMGTGKTIHSSGQIEHYNNDVNEKSMKIQVGKQKIKTKYGYIHPLNIKNG